MAAEFASHPVHHFFDSSSLPDPQFYSHGVSVHPGSRLVFTSGQLGQRKDGSFPETYKDEVHLAFDNLAAVLKAGTADIRDVTKLTWYCVDWNFEEAHNLLEPLVKFLTDSYGLLSRPITTLVPVPKLAVPGARFEVEAVAATGGFTQSWSDGAGRIDHYVAPIKADDVVVVGGGFSGLQAAYDVQKAGFQCMLLEVKSRIGGRSHTIQLASGKGLVELGATWINKTTQPKAYALTQRFGLDCVPQYEIGDSIWQRTDSVICQRRAPKEPPNSGESDIHSLLEAVEVEQSRVDIINTGSFPTSSDISVEEWIQSKGFSKFTQDFMRHGAAALVGREAREVGLHYVVDYIKSGGGLSSLSSEGEYGAQSLKIKQGTSAIATGLARSMKPGSIMLNSPVTRIEQHGSSSTVYTSNGLTVQCSKVILAIPTNVYDNIHFMPPLTPAKRAIVGRTKPGIYAKCILTYRTPWWKQKDINLVGSFFSVNGPINFSWETSDDETSNYSLALFVHGDSAARWHKLSNLGREDAIVNHLAELVGPKHADLARDVVEINYKEWTKEPWIGGAPTSSMGPGDLSKYGDALREPLGCLHFGGGETAREWKGYLEGALRAGSRAAEEVIKSLKEMPSSKLKL